MVIENPFWLVGNEGGKEKRGEGGEAEEGKKAGAGKDPFSVFFISL